MGGSCGCCHGGGGSRSAGDIAVVSFQVLDQFRTRPCPLHHELWLFRPCLPLQHSHLRGGSLEELPPVEHWNGAGALQSLEGGPGSCGAFLPAGSHLGADIPQLWQLLNAYALPLCHPELPPRSETA